ncbi:Crp/Fnr family transcriptional regulator [Limnohabitans sp. 2KL-17]|nr:Crp/Fnr family transcriptional regulator [Limnohabitans sp. 2KL-17]
MPIDFNSNSLIALLPASTLLEWTPHFERVEFSLGQQLFDPSHTQEHLYFPLTAIVSWMNTLQNGSATEVAITGREGMAGIFLLMGAAHTQNNAYVQKAGSALRIRLRVVQESFDHNTDVQKIFFRFTQSVLTQLGQSTACHRHHSLDQQLCRKLLHTLDRQDGEVILMTHELLAQALGVRREGISHAAYRLMKDNIISYARGRIQVIDRQALENRSCECYGVISKGFPFFINKMDVPPLAPAD